MLLMLCTFGHLLLLKCWCITFTCRQWHATPACLEGFLWLHLFARAAFDFVHVQQEHDNMRMRCRIVLRAMMLLVQPMTM